MAVVYVDRTHLFWILKRPRIFLFQFSNKKANTEKASGIMNDVHVRVVI